VLAWVGLWLTVIAPGHERGMIRTDSAENPGKSSCCAGHGAGGKNKTEDEKSSKHDAAMHCALCYLNASLDLPATLDLSLHLLGLLERVAPPAARVLYVAGCASPFHGRAPPITLV